MENLDVMVLLAGELSLFLIGILKFIFINKIFINNYFKIKFKFNYLIYKIYYLYWIL
jgi:hypothetical protein